MSTIKNNTMISMELAIMFAKQEILLKNWAESRDLEEFELNGGDTNARDERIKERMDTVEAIWQREPKKHGFDHLDNLPYMPYNDIHMIPRKGVEIELQDKYFGFEFIEQRVLRVHSIRKSKTKVSDMVGALKDVTPEPSLTLLYTKLKHLTAIDDDKFHELFSDELTRAQVKMRIYRIFNKKIKPHLTVKKIVNMDHKTAYHWLTFVEKVRSHWSKFPMDRKMNEVIHNWSHPIQKPKTLKRMISLYEELSAIDEVVLSGFGRLMKEDQYASASLHDATAFKKWVMKASKYRTELASFEKPLQSTAEDGNLVYTLSRGKRMTRDEHIPKCGCCGEVHFRYFCSVWCRYDQKENEKKMGAPKALCRKCVAKQIKENVEEKRKMTWSSFGGEVCSKTVFTHPTRSYLLDIRENQWLYISKHSGVSVEELQKHYQDDVEHLVADQLNALVKQFTFKEIKDQTTSDKFQAELNIYEGIFKKVRGEGMELMKKIAADARNQFHEMKLHTKFLEMKEKGEKCRELRVAEDYEKMCDTIAEFVQATYQFKNFNRRHGNTIQKNSTLFGMDMKEVGQIFLEKYQVILEDCLNTAKRCQTCCHIAVKGSQEFENMIYTHKPNFDVAANHGALDKLPCIVCRDCFLKTLRHASSIGRPSLRCPCLNCGQGLDEKWVHENAPMALAEYKTALLKFSLKQCHNFKFCPRASCGEGFAVTNSCATIGKRDCISCPACTMTFCPGCNGETHPGVDCLVNMKNIHKSIWGALGEEEKFMKMESKQCPFCLVWIEKNGGCKHMTCKHCFGEFCWDCFGNWQLHSGKSCEDTPKVTRQQFGQIIPYKRWPKNKKVISESEKHDLEFHENLAYQNFISGFGNEDEESFDEQIVYELNPEFVVPVKIVKRVRFADEEEVEGKQDESQDDDLVDKVVSPIQFETSLEAAIQVDENRNVFIPFSLLPQKRPFQIESQQNVAVTPTLSVNFVEEYEAESPRTPPANGEEAGENSEEAGENSEEAGEKMTEAKLLLNAFAQAAAIVLGAKRDPSIQSVEMEESEDKRAPEKCEEAGEPDQKLDEEEKQENMRYNSRWVRLPKECPQTQINYFRFIQDFETEACSEDFETEACTDVKCA